MNNFVIECHNVSKNYTQGDLTISVLQNIDLTLARGQSLAIIGVSGSGKSTLLNLLGGLDKPTQGIIRINGQALQSTDNQLLDDKTMARLRNRELGFVYQLHHLLMEFSALENTMMPLLIGGMPPPEAKLQAKSMLARVGLSHRLHHKPSALSGGERQRVAIARALVTHPSCVLMDEPTGNLDAQTAAKILDLIKQLQVELHLSFVVVTHDVNLARTIGPVMQLQNGQLQLY